jgi:hypothetical protein
MCVLLQIHIKRNYLFSTTRKCNLVIKQNCLLGINIDANFGTGSAQKGKET